MTGTELRAIRKEHGLTQKALAQLLGYRSANYIMRLERGHEDITDRFAQMVRMILGNRARKKKMQEG